MKRAAKHLTRVRLGALAGVGLALFGGSPPACAGWNPFSPGSPVEVGPKSGQIAIADFNGDGHADILASHPLHRRASLALGDGRGEFPMTQRRSLELGYDPSAIAAGDVNADGRPDLAVASRGNATTLVHILLGQGDGRFEEAPESAFSTGKITGKGWKPWLKLADANGDKRLDVIAADGRQNTVTIYLGSGDAQFVAAQTIAVDEGFDRYTHHLGDVNGDDRPDLIVAAAMAEGDEQGRVTVLLSDEKGRLAPAPELSADVPPGAQVKTLCDIDGDKLADIVLTHGESATVLVQGKDGRFAPSSGSPFAMGHEAFGVAAVHAGFDGNDVLVAATAESLDIVYADREGHFQRACGSPIAAGPGAYNVATGDLNGDGKADVVANGFEGNSLSLLLSN
jgi:hypothetical protein